MQSDNELEAKIQTTSKREKKKEPSVNYPDIMRRILFDMSVADLIVRRPVVAQLLRSRLLCY